MSFIDVLVASLTGRRWRVTAHLRMPHPDETDEDVTHFWSQNDSGGGGVWVREPYIADGFDARCDAEAAAVLMTMRNPEWIGKVYVKRA